MASSLCEQLTSPNLEVLTVDHSFFSRPEGPILSAQAVRPGNGQTVRIRP